MIKGKSQHVMPDQDGWCVIDEANQMVVQHFDTCEEALAYARQCAAICEGDVLVHESPCDPSKLSTVPLPQREFIPGMGHSHPGKRSTETRKKRSLFDPFAGLDETYFAI